LSGQKVFQRISAFENGAKDQQHKQRQRQQKKSLHLHEPKDKNNCDDADECVCHLHLWLAEKKGGRENYLRTLSISFDCRDSCLLRPVKHRRAVIAPVADGRVGGTMPHRIITSSRSPVSRLRRITANRES
jgi:hypothetical protein